MMCNLAFLTPLRLLIRLQTRYTMCKKSWKKSKVLLMIPRPRYSSYKKNHCVELLFLNSQTSTHKSRRLAAIQFLPSRVTRLLPISFPQTPRRYRWLKAPSSPWRQVQSKSIVFLCQGWANHWLYHVLEFHYGHRQQQHHIQAQEKRRRSCIEDIY